MPRFAPAGAAVAHPSVDRTRRDGHPGRTELVAMLAALMAMSALAIDAMLPALPSIGTTLGVGDPNRNQLIVLGFLFGFGSAQLVLGPLADRFGRKPVLLAGIIAYSLFSLLCGIAAGFELLVAARVLQGAAAAVARVVVVAMVRDMFEGPAMASTLSLLFMTFMLVPILAPASGQLILAFASWRVIFFLLAGYGLAMWWLALLRLPETLRPENRRALDWRVIGLGFAATLRDRQSLGYTLATTLLFGGFLAYLASIQQILAALGHAEDIGLVFAAVALPMALGAFANSRLVERVGVRRMGNGALIGFALIACAHALLAGILGESLLLFVILIGLAMLCLALASANLSTLAMANMGALAGTASSVQGVMTTVGATLIGLAVGQQFDGSAMPVLIGMAACSAAAVLVVLGVERGRPFARGAPAG